MVNDGRPKRGKNLGIRGARNLINDFEDLSANRYHPVEVIAVNVDRNVGLNAGEHILTRSSIGWVNAKLVSGRSCVEFPFDGFYQFSSVREAPL